jgi:hypothetical protein
MNVQDFNSYCATPRICDDGGSKLNALLLVRSDLKTTVELQVEDGIAVKVEIPNLTTPILAISLYHWTRGGLDMFNDLLEQVNFVVENFITNYPGAQVIVMGDLNLTR